MSTENNNNTGFEHLRTGILLFGDIFFNKIFSWNPVY